MNEQFHQNLYKRYTTAQKKSWGASELKEYLWGKLFEQLEPYLESFSGKKIRIGEVGCGYGGVLHRFGKKLPLAEQYGVDIREEVINKAKTVYPETHFYHGDARHLPFEEGMFDITLQFVFLCTIRKEQEQAVSEMIRVTKKKGLVISFDLRYPSPRKHIHRLGEKRVRQLFGNQVQCMPVWLPPQAQHLPLGLAKKLYACPFLRSHLLSVLMVQ